MKECLRKIKNNVFRINGGFLLITIFSFVLGWQLGHKDYSFKLQNYKPDLKITNQQPEDKNTNLDFKLFWITWDLVSKKYIDKSAIDPQKLYYGAIQGMVAAIGDPYTVFLPPQAQKASKEQLGGAFEGVGMQLGYNKDKRLVVIAPLKDTPAFRAGVASGDLILKIDGKDSVSLSLPEAVTLIRGPKGSTVNLTLFGEKDSQPREIKLVRDTIVVKSVEAEVKTTSSKDNTQGDIAGAEKPTNVKTTKTGKKIAHIRITSFGEKTKSEWDEAVSAALAGAVSGVIVDVRNNPGGFLDDATYIASEFLEGGNVVLQEDYQGRRVEQPVVKTGKLLKLPVVILINKGSASASEILAGAIQDRKRGTLVGEQSFGKGTIQSTEDLPDGTGIHITTAKWLTPNGRWIHTVGLTPDVKIDLGTDPKVDSQLDKALEILDK